MPSEDEHSYHLDAKGCDSVRNLPVNLDKQSVISKRTTKCKAEFVVAIDRSTFYEDQEGLHFHGVLSVPRASLNGWIYLPEELHAQDGKTVTLFINHEEIFSENPTKRGTMSVFYNHETFNLEYNATATDQEAIDGIKSGKYKHVSMGAMWAGEDKIRGWLFPYGVEIVEGSLVENPGIPEATVVMDSAFMIDNVNGGITVPLEKCTTEFCKMLKSSLKNEPNKPAQNMAKKPKADNKLSEALNKLLEDEEANRDEILEQIAQATGLETKEVEDILSGNSECPEDKIEAFYKILNIPLEETADKKSADKKQTPKGDSGPREIIVKVDATEINEALERQNQAMLDFMEKFNAPKPKGIVATDDNKRDDKAKKDHFYQIVGDSLKKFQALDWNYIATKMKSAGIGLDAIGMTEVGTAAGAQWLEDLTIVPSGLPAGLRSTAEVVMINRGAKEVHFTLISTPAPVDGTQPNVPADVTHEITDVTATPAERILKQRLADQAARNTSVNLGRGIADTFRDAEMLDEDAKLLTELNGITAGNLAGTVFAGGKTAENQITSSDIFTHNLLAATKRMLLRKGWREARIPGRLVCVMSPEQMEQLMGDTGIQRFIEWVQNGEALVSGFIPRLHGIDLLVSTEVPTGTGATTEVTHRAFVYIRQVSVGLGFTKDLEIESARYIEERATTIVATYELAAKTKSEISVARIITYGSG